MFGEEPTCVLFVNNYHVLQNVTNAPHIGKVDLEEGLSSILPSDVTSLAIVYEVLGKSYAMAVPNEFKID